MPAPATFLCLEVNDYVLLSASGRWIDGSVFVEHVREAFVAPGSSGAEAVASLLRGPSQWVGCGVRPAHKRLLLSSPGDPLPAIGSDMVRAVAGLAGIRSTGEVRQFVATAPKSEVESALSVVRNAALEPNESIPASFALVRGVSSALESEGDRVLVWDAAEEESQLMVVGSSGIVGCCPIPFGLDRIFEFVRVELSLKLKGAAARLFFSDTFDFSDLGPRVARGIGEAMAPYVRTLTAQAEGRIGGFLMVGLPLSHRWFGEALARELHLAPFAADAKALAARLEIGFAVDASPRGDLAPWLGVLSYLRGVVRPGGDSFSVWASDEPAIIVPKIDAPSLFLPDSAPTPPPLATRAAVLAEEAAARQSTPPQPPAEVAPIADWQRPERDEWAAAARATQPGTPTPKDGPTRSFSSLVGELMSGSNTSPTARTATDVEEPLSALDTMSVPESLQTNSPVAPQEQDKPRIPVPDALKAFTEPPVAPPQAYAPPDADANVPPISLGATMPGLGVPQKTGSGKTWAAIAALNQRATADGLEGRPDSVMASMAAMRAEAVAPDLFAAAEAPASPLAGGTSFGAGKTRRPDFHRTQAPYEPARSVGGMAPAAAPRKRTGWAVGAAVGVLLLLFGSVVALRSRSEPATTATVTSTEIPAGSYAAPEATGRVLFSTLPRDATVSVNNRTLAIAPGRPVELPVGRHDLIFAYPGFQEKHVQVEVQDGRLLSLGVLELQRATGTLKVESTVPRAQVSVVPLQAPGGLLGVPELSGAASGAFEGVPAAKYRVTASLEGWPVQRFEVDVKAGETTTIPVAWPSGKVKVETVPSGVEVTLNDRPVGRSPITVEAPPGVVRLSASANGYQTFETRQSVTEAQTSSVVLKLVPSGRVFAIQELDRRPQPLSVTGPSSETGEGRVTGRVVVSLIVDVNGNTRDHQVVEASNPELARRVLDVCSSWRFTPGELGGKAVECRVEVPITVGR